MLIICIVAIATIVKFARRKGVQSAAGEPILPLPDEFIVVFLLLCAVVGGRVLYMLGTPEDAVYALAPLLMGLTVLLIELRTRRPFGTTSFGPAFMVGGGLWFALFVGVIFGSQIGWLTLGVEIAIAIAAFKLMRA